MEDSVVGVEEDMPPGPQVSPDMTMYSTYDDQCMLVSRRFVVLLVAGLSGWIRQKPNLSPSSTNSTCCQLGWSLDSEANCSTCSGVTAYYKQEGVEVEEKHTTGQGKN